MKATELIWRYTVWLCLIDWAATPPENCGERVGGKWIPKSKAHKPCGSQLETYESGMRCDWAKGGAYDQLGMAVPL